MTLQLDISSNLPRDRFRYVAKGRDRAVYTLDGHPSILAKVLNPESPQVQRVLDQETRFWRTHHDDAAIPVTRIFGQCMTALGEAQITEAVLDENGKIAPNLLQLLEQGDFTQIHITALNHFVREAVANHITLSDFSFRNLVFGRRVDEQNPRIYVVDGFGDKSFIKLKQWSRWANAPHILRKFARVPRGYGVIWDLKSQHYSLQGIKP